MAGHRYWRVNCTTSGASGLVACSEIEMRTVPGGVDQCTGGTASASSTFAGFTAAGAFDDSLATSTANMWASTTLPAQIEYDFGAGVTPAITEFTWIQRTDTAVAQSVTSGTLDFSDNGSSWTTLFSFVFPTVGAAGQAMTAPNAGVPNITGWDPNKSTVTWAVDESVDYTWVYGYGSGSSVATRKATTPKFYFEIDPALIAGNTAVGLANGSWAGTAGLLGTTANSVGYRLGTGAVNINSVTVATIQTCAQGTVIGIAGDLLAGLFWITTNGTTWNNAVIGSQNPVGNVGGISLATFSGSIFFPAVSDDTAFTMFQGAFKASAFTYTPPTGYSGVDVVNNLMVNAAVGLSSTYPTSNGRQTNGAPYGGQFSPAGNITHVSGFVQESAVAVAGKTVRAYDSVTAEFLGFATSAGDGSWSIPALGRVLIDASARDDPVFDGIIHVRVVPV